MFPSPVFFFFFRYCELLSVSRFFCFFVSLVALRCCDCVLRCSPWCCCVPGSRFYVCVWCPVYLSVCLPACRLGLHVCGSPSPSRSSRNPLASPALRFASATTPCPSPTSPLPSRA